MTLRKAFDGEVFYWYEDDPSVRRDMSTVNVDPLRCVGAKIYTQADLDRARQEERRAAFKDGRFALIGIHGSTSPDPIHRKGFTAGVNAAIQALEAAANETREDEDERQSDKNTR